MCDVPRVSLIWSLTCFFFVSTGAVDKIKAALTVLETSATLAENVFLQVLFYVTLKRAGAALAEFPRLTSFVAAHAALESKAKALLSVSAAATTAAATEAAPAVPAAPLPPVTRATLATSIDWTATGLISSLKLVFDAAIVAAFPEAEALGLNKSVIARCANAKNGDFQCNNAMSLAKAIKTEKDTMGHYAGKSIVHYARERERKRRAHTQTYTARPDVLQGNDSLPATLKGASL